MAIAMFILQYTKVYQIRSRWPEQPIAVKHLQSISLACPSERDRQILELFDIDCAKFQFSEDAEAISSELKDVLLQNSQASCGVAETTIELSKTSNDRLTLQQEVFVFQTDAHRQRAYRLLSVLFERLRWSRYSDEITELVVERRDPEFQSFLNLCQRLPILEMPTAALTKLARNPKLSSALLNAVENGPPMSAAEIDRILHAISDPKHVAFRL